MDYSMIRTASPDESDLLTEISCASKAYWDYPAESMAVFKKELKITEEYIRSNRVWVYELENNPVAYYSIKNISRDIVYPDLTIQRGYWLDHLFVAPEYIGRGIGRTLFEHMVLYITDNKISSIHILADPNSRGFYEKMGCSHMAEYPSSIEGRTTPYLVYNNSGEFRTV